MPTTPTRAATIAELLAEADRPLYSFEFFPPKDAEGEQTLWRTVRELEPLRPDFVSVTYGASGSTRERTVRVTERVARDTTLRTMAHLTCASQPAADLRRTIGAYAASGLRHVLAVRGDPPGGPTATWHPHPQGLANATELVELVASLGDFCIGVAAFPDLHPDRRDADLDARVLIDKARAGASFAITQLFFDAEAWVRLVDRVRSAGCDLPIIPGIQPVTNLGQVKRFAELSGAELPSRVVDRLNAVGDDPAQVRRVGVDIATELSERLLEAGAPGLHFFTLNRSRASREIFARLA